MSEDRKQRARNIGDMITAMINDDEVFVFVIFPFNEVNASIDLVCNCNDEGLKHVMEALNESIRQRGQDNMTMN